MFFEELVEIKDRKVDKHSADYNVFEVQLVAIENPYKEWRFYKVFFSIEQTQFS